jgi:tripartite ATP-independent transporter DctM subunit
MADWFETYAGPMMFGSLLLFMLIGYPAAFSLAAVGLFFGFVAVQLGVMDVAFLGNLIYQVAGSNVLDNELLLAIPFFTFMGAILERSGLTEDMLEGFGQLFGPVRGGLSYAVIIVGAILGAITGTVAASVIAMGLISLPIMLKYGYSVRHATGVIAASGTITQLIPPALVLVVLAQQLQVDVGSMYAGAIGPSILQVLIFCGFVFVVSLVRPKDVPALPPEARTLSGWPLFLRCMRGIIPSMVLIFIVLGTILIGVATPTAAGAMGVVGAMLLAWFNRRLTWELTWSGMNTTLRLTAMVMLILIGARVFSLVFEGVGGEPWLKGLLGGLGGEGATPEERKLWFMIFTMMMIFFLAFFLDFFEIAFIIVPLILPAAREVGITGNEMVWFGVLIGANLQTSFMHPPFGFALFYLRGIAPRDQVKSSDIYWGAVPWVGMQLLLVAVVVAFPETVTFWLPEEQVIDMDAAGQQIQQQFNLPPPDLSAPDLGIPGLTPPEPPPPIIITPGQ